MDFIIHINKSLLEDYRSGLERNKQLRDILKRQKANPGRIKNAQTDVDWYQKKLNEQTKKINDWINERNELVKKNKALSDRLKELGEKSPLEDYHPRLLPAEPSEPPANTESGLSGGGEKKKPPEETKGPTFFPPDIEKWLQDMGFPPARPKSGPKMK